MPCETHLCKHSENPPLWAIKSELLWIPSPNSSKPNHSKSAEISQLWSQFLAITGMLSLSYLNHSIDQFNQKSKAFMDQFLKLFHTKHENFLADRDFFCMFCLALCYRAQFQGSSSHSQTQTGLGTRLMVYYHYRKCAASTMRSYISSSWKLPCKQALQRALACKLYQGWRKLKWFQISKKVNV